MTRFTALLVVALIAGASARLLVCDYSCRDHTRAHQSSQPLCHESEPQAGSALTAGENDCDAQPAVLDGILIGKLTSVNKPALLATHVIAARAQLLNAVAAAQPRAPSALLPTLSHTTPLRI